MSGCLGLGEGAVGVMAKECGSSWDNTNVLKWMVVMDPPFCEHTH